MNNRIDHSINVETWEDMKKKYRVDRDELTEAEEKIFVSECFKCYENEELSKVFWTQGTDYKKYIGKTFKLIGRKPLREDDKNQGVDLECQPMWAVKFEDGFEMDVFPDEIFLREMKENGYVETK